MIVGGHERTTGERSVLREVCAGTGGGGGPLLIVAVPGDTDDGQADAYATAFRELGVRRVDRIEIRTRAEALEDGFVRKVRAAQAVFFAGGDQLRTTSQIGDSPGFTCMRERYAEGATIAGTAAGAAVMAETMLVGGPDDQSHEISALVMGAGLGFISGVIVDTHFAERGRLGRLLGAVAQNPKNLGLGIDEDTAVVVRNGTELRVVGSGGVYVLDGTGITYSSLSEARPEGVATILDARVHVLADGDCYDLARRRPASREATESPAA